ncbi:hypothetical protein KI387_023505 [Taxus chinensis]|uniref:Uncharacterized protein n=1 Tax=Taxus chinensis TaxID=29808 RepID=A0AA38G3Z0_TAXCH|nr:hypothetical protein KI387_023505 [Taxus chinensis]
MGRKASNVKEDILLLLEEFKEELNSLETEENLAFTEKEWFSHLELKFLLGAQRVAGLRSFASQFETLHKQSSRARLKEALSFVQELLEKIEIKSQKRLLATKPGSIPIVLSLAHRYKLSAEETDLFQLLFVRGASRSTLVRTSTAIVGRKDDKEIVMHLCGMSYMDLQDFLDDKRTHISEGIVIQIIQNSRIINQTILNYGVVKLFEKSGVLKLSADPAISFDSEDIFNEDVAAKLACAINFIPWLRFRSFSTMTGCDGGLSGFSQHAPINNNNNNNNNNRYRQTEEYGNQRNSKPNFYCITNSPWRR